MVDSSLYGFVDFVFGAKFRFASAGLLLLVCWYSGGGFLVF